MAMSRKTKTAYSRLKKRKKKLVVKSKRKLKFINLFNPLLPSAAYAVPFSEFKKRSPNITSYDRHDYESVDEKSLS